MIDLRAIATMGFYTTGLPGENTGGLIVFDELELDFDEELAVKVTLDPDEVIDINANSGVNSNITNVSEQNDVRVTVVPAKKLIIDTSKTC